MVMGCVAKMFTQQKMDTNGRTKYPVKQFKMAMQSSPEVATIATQLQGGQEDSGGIVGTKLMKMF